MKSILSIAAFNLLLITGLGSCSKEPSNPVERNFTIDNFNAIAGGEQFRFTLSAGPLYSIKASGESRDLNDLVLQKSGNTLSIAYDHYRSGRKIVYFTVTMPSLRLLNLSGQAQATIDNFAETAPVGLQLSGQSQCWIISSAPKYAALVEGQSFLQFQGGAANELQLEATGQSNIQSYGLPVAKVSATASGQSVIRTRVSQQFTADASGQSRIYFKGSPGIRNITISGQAAVVEE